MNRQVKALVAGCLLVAAAGVPAALPAAEATPAATGWEHSIVLYLLGPNIDGRVGIGGLEGEVNIDPGDVFAALDGGFLAAYTVEKGGWGAAFDLVYMDLEEGVEGVRLPVPGEIGVEQLIFGVSGTYRLNGVTQLLVGGRYVDLSNTLTLELPPAPLRFQLDESWFDPTVGLRFNGSISDRWTYAAMGDMGGFGVGSDLTWQLSGSLGFRMTEHSVFTFGYRYIDFDYEEGEGSGAFKFDVAEYGLALGVRFEF